MQKIEGTGVENANDLRDQRDKALDELSEYIDISYYEVQGGEIYVNAGGVPFCDNVVIYADVIKNE